VPDQEAETRGAPEPHAYKTVLLVDDNPVARGVHAKQLRTLGCLVDTAESGNIALELARARMKKGRHYDAVFMDWELPEMDGWSTLSQLQKLISEAPEGTEPNHTRYVMVSAHGQDTLQSRSKKDTDMLDAFLVKPVTPEMLAEALTLKNGEKRVRAKASKEAQAELPLKGMRLLLVEDNVINQQVARELLKRQGAEVQVAENGQVSLDMLRKAETPFHVVLMDMQMPVMDGIQATQAIRQKMGMMTLPIIAMTANAMASDREACLEAGMNDHIGKPFDLKRLVKLLLEWSGWASASNPSAEGAKPAAKAPPQPDLPVLDSTAAIDRLGKDADFYSKMLASFAADMPQMIKDLEQLWAEDVGKAAAMCHAIKGTAATVGAVSLAKLASTAEEAAKAASLEASQPKPSAPATPLPFPAEIKVGATRTLEAIQKWQLAHVPAVVAPTNVDISQVNRQAVIDELHLLEHFLADFDMAANDVHERLQALGSRRPGADRLWAQLHVAIDHLNFEEALTTTQALLTSITSS
jgi:CheY-like chemotaxis protein